MNRNLLVVSLLMLAFCMIMPCVSAKAETTREVLKGISSETYTYTYDLTPGSPYTQVKQTITLTTELSGQYHTVLDAKGNMHVNAKLLFQETLEGESWFWDDALQKWVSGQVASRTSKRIIIYNEIIVDSETQTIKQLVLSREKFSAEGINPDNGEAFTLDFMIIRHLMLKAVNGELQFEHRWEIVKGTQRLSI